VICDVYGTLLRVEAPPADAAARWQSGCREIGSRCRTLTLEAFRAKCEAAIRQRHRELMAAGEPFPEVPWLEIVGRIAEMDGEGADEAALRLSSLFATCARSTVAMAGAREFIAVLRGRGMLLGIASNAQHYTRDELARAGIPLADFTDDLCLFSGDHGFAKPSPRVFSLLTERLASRGISPAETLMAGDDPDKDILPAARAGWQTWHWSDNPERGWKALAAAIPDSRGKPAHS
jgi:HAD superfamily hydrolase (TIGR01549 family)